MIQTAYFKILLRQNLLFYVTFLFTFFLFLHFYVLCFMYCDFYVLKHLQNVMFNVFNFYVLRHLTLYNVDATYVRRTASLSNVNYKSLHPLTLQSLSLTLLIPEGVCTVLFFGAEIQPKHLVFCNLGFLPSFSLVFCFLPHPMHSHF